MEADNLASKLLLVSVKNSLVPNALFCPTIIFPLNYYLFSIMLEYLLQFEIAAILLIIFK